MHAELSGHMNVLIAGKVNHDRHGIDSCVLRATV